MLHWLEKMLEYDDSGYLLAAFKLSRMSNHNSKNTRKNLLET